MRSPAAAVAWEFRQRHRWGVIAIVALLCVLGLIRIVVLVQGFPINFDSDESFAFVVVVPISVTFTYFLAVFTFGLEGDLAARQSMYPARMFTRPVTTAALAGWPMLYGAAASAILWTLTRLLALWPSSVHVPTIWPGILAVAHLAWTQALTWMPYGWRGLRVIVVMLWLVVIDTIVLLALHFGASEPVMAAILLPLIPLAWLVARFAVARARRGDVPDWRGGFTWFAGLGRVSRPQRFTSPASAQAWFEWRRNGWSLPVWVAILLPVELLRQEDDAHGLSRDVRFIAELIDTLGAHFNIDPARIYADGLSNGGGMAFALSCTLSHRIAAVGLVASAQLLPFKWCADRHPVPMIDFHGTSDPAVPYKGGTSWVVPGYKRFPNQLTWVANWAQRNRCAPAPVDSVVAPDVTRRVYTLCADNAAVVLYTIQGGGHTWPGGGPMPEWYVGRTSHSIDASSVMWAFFREHPLTRK